MGRVEMARCFLHNQNFSFGFLPFFDLSLVPHKSQVKVFHQRISSFWAREVFFLFLRRVYIKQNQFLQQVSLSFTERRRQKNETEITRRARARITTRTGEIPLLIPDLSGSCHFPGMYMYIVIYAYFPECGKEKASRVESSTRDDIKTRTIIMLIMIIAPDTQRVKRHRSDVLHRIKAGTSGCATASENAKITDASQAEAYSEINQNDSFEEKHAACDLE